MWRRRENGWMASNALLKHDMMSAITKREKTNESMKKRASEKGKQKVRQLIL